MNKNLLKQTILVVDDVPENIDVLRNILESKYRIKAAFNAKKALSIAMSEPHPDLILLDIMMPGLDGHQVCIQLKTNDLTKKIPVIFVTAKGEIEDETHGFQIGAVDYITKPVSAPIVLARVETHLASHDQNRVLEGKVEERTLQLKNALQKLKKSSLDTIYRLSRAAEYKDEDTGSHLLRMSRYSAAIAEEMNLNDETVESILFAAPMHDIGKIGIPDQILLKPGKLDAHEWKLMKQHTDIGAQILDGSDEDIIKLGETIALTHHEKWDGSGYPKKLAGSSIPLVGRIVAIGDVFDALTSQRPYKEPFSLDKSFSIILENRGKHFDPNVVEAFFAVKDNILAIKETYNDSSEGSQFLKISRGLKIETDGYWLRQTSSLDANF